jgi:hypothetical protein
MKMRKITVLAGLLFFVFAMACNKVRQLANINVDIPYSTTINIPGTAVDAGLPFPPQGISLPFPAFPIATNSKQQLAQNNTIAEKVIEADLKTLSLTIVSPPDLTFDFVDSVRLYISAKNLPEQLVAYEYNIPKGLHTLNLTTNTNVNLKDYFLQDTMYFRFYTHINSLPPKTDGQLNVAAVMHVLANPLQ